MPGQNYILLDRIELNNTASSVTFSNIPQTGYTDLKLVMSVRGSRALQYDGMTIAFNGTSTSTNWTSRVLYSTYTSGTGASSSGTDSGITWIDANTATASTFGNAEYYIPNYTSSNAKSVSADSMTENNATLAVGQMAAGLWNNSSAINSITLTPSNGSILANSTFSLYGIANFSTTPLVAPKASGGNVIGTDGTYWYHAFLSNGTFTPQTMLTAEVLVIAGGGGGSGSSGGGGGAGGLSYLASSSLTTTGYTCTVGAGSGANSFTAGTDSTFNSIVSKGGGYGNNSAGAAGSGGSGGGGGEGGAAGSSTQTNTGGATGYGNAGGTGSGLSGYPHAGGGGAGAVGGNAGNNLGGTGGAGKNTWSAWASATGTGVSGYYAGGGGGGTYTGTGGTGGSGGGGNGGGATATATVGVANTGGGGGGGGATNDAKAGGSGIIIIRYPIAS